MLGHSDRDRRQLGHLTPRRLGGIDPLTFGERARARSAAVGPMLNDPVDLLGRKQPPVPALVPVLPAPLPARPLPTRTTRSRRGILRRRKRRVPRTPVQTTLKLGNPGLEPFIRLDQTLVRIHQLVEPHQQPNSSLTIAIEDRLGLGPLHATSFATRTRVPAPPERLPVYCSVGRLRASDCASPAGGAVPVRVERALVRFRPGASRLVAAQKSHNRHTFNGDARMQDLIPEPPP